MKFSPRTIVTVEQTQNQIVTDNSLKYSPVNMTTALIGNNNQQAPIVERHHYVMNNKPEDGRINYSKKATQNYGTKHVVNMLGEFFFSFLIY